LLSIPAYKLLFHTVGMDGLAIASDIGILVHTLTLAILLHRRRLVLISGLEGAELIRSLQAAIISGGTIILLLRALPRSEGHLQDVIALTVGGLIWAALAYGTLLYTGSKLPGQLLARRR
jgi:putative peptidoglycan lipid II flippase